MHFLNPDKNGEKFKYQLPKKADPTSKPDEKPGLNPFQQKRKKTNASQMLGKLLKESVLLLL